MNKSIFEKDTKKTTTNNSTFNRLRELQALIKKESALKELCKNIILINNQSSY